jgi:alpha-ketoglutarate-dependent taurine dioxygenase
MALTITPLTAHTGIEVTGLDFAQPIDPADRAVLRRAFVEHHVLVVRDQHFAPDQFTAAAELFGEARKLHSQGNAMRFDKSQLATLNSALSAIVLLGA